MDLGKRILVLGCPGSDKSTFALRLQTETRLPLVHLDALWWLPDRTHISREEFDRRLASVITSGQWIIEGDYSRTYEVRIAACDTVIFLDPDEEECMRGILSRIGKKRPDMPWTEDRPDPELAESVRNYRSQKRPVLMSLFKKYPEKQVFIFKSRAQSDAWLEELTKEAAK